MTGGVIRILDPERGTIRVGTPLGTLQGPKEQVLARIEERSRRLEDRLQAAVKAHETLRLMVNLNALVAAAVQWSDWLDFLKQLKVDDVVAGS